jgi:hypothetical protein
MRSPRWRAARWLAAALGVAACSFDPTRPCNSDGDCVNGGTCDLGTRTCVAAGDPNDHTPPVFSVLVSPAPSRQDTAVLKVLDPRAPDGGVGVFRRDERVRVAVVSDDVDVQLSSVTLTVQGVAPGGDPGTGLAISACSSGSPGAGRAFCVETEAALGPPIPLSAFRGAVRFTARGTDRSGNAAVPVSTSVDVTRWKWRYATGTPIRTTPAIADDGTVVFGTSNGTAGSLYALAPGGGEKWPPIALGPIEASVAIGELVGAQQLLYVGTAARPSTLYAFSVGDGSPGASCLGSTNSKPGGEVRGALAVFTSSGVGGPYESATAFSSDQQLVTIRPRVSAPDPACTSAQSSGSQVTRQNVVVNDSELYFATDDGVVRAFLIAGGTWQKNSGWGSGLGSVIVGESIATLALSNRLLATNSFRGVLALDRFDGSFVANAPDGGVQNDPGGPSISTSGILFPDGAALAPAIVAAETDLTSHTRVPLSGAGSISTIAIGSAGSRYLLTLDGHLESHLLTLALDWSEELDATSFESSPTIDCFRDGGTPAQSGTGVLYAGSTAGNLFAVIVDDPGLDVTAPWPKYQHDIRNTGNPGTSLQSCP